MPKSLNDLGEWAENERGKLMIYMGKTGEYLKRDLGEPVLIKQDILYKRKHYDEWWRYKYSRGAPIIHPQEWVYDFYLNNGVVEYIDVF